MGGVSGSCSVISQSSSQLPIIDAAPREHFPAALYLIIIHHRVSQLFLVLLWTGSQSGGSPVGIRSCDFRQWRSYMITFLEEKYVPVCHHDPFQAVLTQIFPPLRGELGLDPVPTPHPSFPAHQNTKLLRDSFTGALSFLRRRKWTQGWGSLILHMSFPLSPNTGATWPWEAAGDPQWWKLRDFNSSMTLMMDSSLWKPFQPPSFTFW